MNSPSTTNDERINQPKPKRIDQKELIDKDHDPTIINQLFELKQIAITSFVYFHQGG
jgi:hypothetical protein